jgi:hypothetical protein
MGSSITAPRAALSAAIAVFAALALLVTPSARPDLTPPLVNLGPVTVANGTATLSGTIGGPAEGSLKLSVNGQPLSLDAAGNFAGSVSLNGQSSINLALRNPLTGDTFETRIPLTLAVGGVIPPGVLSAIEQAGVSLLKAVGLDGKPVDVEGQVLDAGQLASLKVNGVDALGLLQGRTFGIQLPGTTKEVTVSVTDKQGVSQSSTYGVQHLLSTPQGTSVSAAEALGVRIASVRYYTKRAAKTHRVRMIVTLKDRRGYLVRGATVQVRSAKAGRTIGRQKAKRTSRLGRAGFVVRIRTRALGRRLVMVTTARTPTATAKKTTSAKLPRRPRAHARSHR